MQVNREILQEGWLVKSPPTKRILRARWRRRWFTLKQGEIPGQFCLEYYTDRNCRKLKGVIDLDQCEQVDSGLRLEHRKQKFQHMFDIKTPRRTYYLAADTEQDMRDWVNCICQVCNLHESSNDRQYYNLLPPPAPKSDLQKTSQNSNKLIPSQNIHESSPVDSISNVEHLRRNQSKENQADSSDLQTAIVEGTSELNIGDDEKNLQNHEMPYVNTEFFNKEVDLCDKNKQSASNLTSQQNLSNTTTNDKNERSDSFQQNDNENKSHLSNNGSNRLSPQPPRSKSEIIGNAVIPNSGAIKKKIPENLVLTGNIEEQSGNIEPSPALSTSSGPYIPLSQCFSGSPKYLNNPTTPLNSLDPKFYETPRNSHINFGLNLTNDQSYSPKISNCSVQEKSRSGHSTDSESVFTDEDEFTYRPSRNDGERKARPSDSSVENDLIVFSYDQRFSKFNYETPSSGNEQPGVVNEENKRETFINPFQGQKRDSKNSERRMSAREFSQLSDTENTSPASVVTNTTLWVNDQRTQHYCNMSNIITASTPNLYSENQSKALNFVSIQSGTLPRSNPFVNSDRSEGNVFRYDFVDKGKSQILSQENILPPVNRELKPKHNLEKKSSGLQSKSTSTINNISSSDMFAIKPPSIDRSLKPSLKTSNAESPNRRSHIPTTSTNTFADLAVIRSEFQTQTLPRTSTSSQSNTNLYGNNNSIANMSNQINPIYNNNNVFVQNFGSPGTPNSINVSPGFIQMQKLEYCDLEIANGPPTNRSSMISTISQQSDMKTPPKSNTVYRSIDFEKTRVLNQIREDTQVRSRRKD